MATPHLTHAQLVERAGRWLRSTGHRPVLLEIGSAAECPDAIGWRAWTATLLECKTSRADFLADRHKPFRAHPERGMARLRWYLTPQGLLDPQEVPARWGLLEAKGRSIRIVKRATPFYDWAWRSEMMLLTSACRRAIEGWGQRVFGELEPPGGRRCGRRLRSSRWCQLAEGHEGPCAR